MSNSKIFIAEQGLIKISKELINKRTYLEKLITIVGTPFVSDGVAGSIDGLNYFTHSGLSLFGSTNLKINAKGTFSSSDSTTIGQTLWSLQNNDSEKLSLQFFSDKIQVILEDAVLVELSDLIYSPDETVNISLDLTNSTYRFIIVKDDKYQIYNGTLSQSIDITSFTSVNIGALSYGSDSCWNGTINLADFIILKDNSIYYSPSTDPTFDFTRILVSDGTIPLTDSSTPVINHIYEFEISEIQRTGSNVLLVSQIGGDAHLNITTIGIYSTGSDGTRLFATIEGLAIKKGSDLGYNLIFNVRMNIGVVNTVAFPEIILASDEHPSMTDFNTVKNAYTYLVTNLERCVVLNATELGRERDQNVFQLENTYELQQANYNSSKIFADIKKKIHESESTTYNANKVAITGSPTVSSTGVASGFSNSSYVGVNGDVNETANLWEFRTVFMSDQPSSATRTVASFYSSAAHPALVLGISSSNKCFVELNKQEAINILNTALGTPTKFIRTPLRDTLNGSTHYYAWRNAAGSPWVNTHVTTTGELINENSNLSNFSSTSYAYTESSFNFDDFELVFQCTTPTIGSLNGILSSTTGDYRIELALGTDGKLTYAFGNGTSWVVQGTGTNVLQSETSYHIKIKFDGGQYSGSISTDGGTTFVSDWTTTNTSIPASGTIRFGLDNSGNAWSSSISLEYASLLLSGVEAWSGSFSSVFAYTTTVTPTVLTPLYDGEFYNYNYSTIASVVSGAILNRDLFTVDSGRKCYIKVIYDGYDYSLLTSFDGSNYKIAYSLVSDELVNFIQRIDFGVTEAYNGTSNPFTNGKVYLGESRAIINSVEYSPVDVTYNNKCLKDFYSFINPKKSAYYVKNLSGLASSRIRVVEDNIEGSKDSIDFSSSDGFSLCVKANLLDNTDKIILAKMNMDEDEKYFVLKYENSTLTFNLYTENSIIDLSKVYTTETSSKVTSTPILISVVYDNYGETAGIKLYVNNSLERSIVGGITGFLTASEYSLYNVDAADEVAENNYVEGIASFNGVLSADDITYLSNITNSNY